MKSGEHYRRIAIRHFDETRNDGRFHKSVCRGLINMGEALTIGDNSPFKDVVAMVAVFTKDKKVDNFRLHVNPRIFSGFSDEEASGVLWHEFNHIANDHLNWEKNKGYDDKLLNYAKEIVCNDVILHEGHALPLQDSIISGVNVLGFNTFPSNTQEVYDLLKENSEKVKEWEKSRGSGGDGGECGKIIVVDENGNIIEITDEMAKEISEKASEIAEEIKKAMDRDLSSGEKKSDHKVSSEGDNDEGGTRGRGSSAAITSFDDSFAGDDLGFLWRKIANDIKKNINPAYEKSRVQIVPDWTSRSMYGNFLPSNMILPGEAHLNDNDMISCTKTWSNSIKLVIAIDQSGSIPEDVVREVVSQVYTFPSSFFSVEYVAFSELCKKIDIENPNNNYGIEKLRGGGTSFLSVYDYVESINFKGNVAVLLVTDGYGNFADYNGFSGRDSSSPTKKDRKEITTNDLKNWWFMCCRKDTEKDVFIKALASSLRGSEYDGEFDKRACSMTPTGEWG